MNKILLVLLGFMPLLAAQNSTSSRPANVETRLVRLQHADPRKVRDMLVGTGAQVSWDNVLGAIVISGTPSDVASLEQTAKQLDADSAKQPKSDVQLILYVLGASEKAPSGPIPSALQPALNELKPLFPYDSYQLLETALARAGVGQYTSVQGALHAFGASSASEQLSATPYHLQFTVTGITGSGAATVVHLNNFAFNSNFVADEKTPSTTRTQSIPVSIQTNLDIGSGQKVVVGKAGAGGSNAIFLIVEARVAN